MEKITFMSEGFKIEGLLDPMSDDRGVVITHPHPLYGGDMYNYVVESIARIYKENKYTTLRFNFRGAGESGGKYDNGIGEQQDVVAALSHLYESGIKKLCLAGYSFGAWVNAHAAEKSLSVQEMLVVSPPVAFMDYTDITPNKKLKLVVTGSNDEIAPPEKIHKLLPDWNNEALFEVIQGADHFYSGYLNNLESVLSSYIK